MRMVEDGISYEEEKSKKSVKSKQKSVAFPPIPKKKSKKIKIKKNDNLDKLAKVIMHMIELSDEGKEIDFE